MECRYNRGQVFSLVDVLTGALAAHRGSLLVPLGPNAYEAQLSCG